MKWFDIADYMTDLRAISIIIGGRGIGKTYSVLRFLIDSGKLFLYVRNTKQQIAECASEFGNPFKKLNKDLGYDNKVIGYASPLSVFNNLRGADLSDVDYVIFDEFIENRTLMFDQFKAFVNMRETVGRNRELLGEEPLYCFLLSNSQSLNNPILLGYNLVPTIEAMIKNNQQKMKKKDLLLLLPESEISELKKKTSTYSGLEGTKIYEENLNNKFANDSFYGIKKRNLREYRPLCQIDDIYIYLHKSSAKKYACASQALNIPVYTSKDNALAFYSSFGRYLPMEYAAGNLEFSDFTIKSKLLKIIQ